MTRRLTPPGINPREPRGWRALAAESALHEAWAIVDHLEREIAELRGRAGDATAPAEDLERQLRDAPATSRRSRETRCRARRLLGQFWREMGAQLLAQLRPTIRLEDARGQAWLSILGQIDAAAQLSCACEEEVA